MTSAKEQAAAAVETVKASHPVRAYNRYSEVRGNVLAGGIAYFAFFSLFPALAVGLSFLGSTLRGQPELVQGIVDGVNSYLPGLLHPGTSSGVDQPGIYVDDWLRRDVLGVVASVGLVTLLITGLGWMDALRQSVRAVFGDDAGGGNVVVLKLYDVAVFLVIGLGLLVSVLSVVASTAAADFVLGLFGAERSPVGRALLRGLGIFVPLVVDTALFLAVFRLLPGADVPLRDLFSGAVIGGVGLGILKQIGTQVASRSADNPFLQAAASLVVILVLMNLIGRLTLFAAAWAATNAEEHGTLHAEPETRTFNGAHPVPPPARPHDHATLAAGLLLGAVGTSAVLGARRAAGLAAGALVTVLRGRR